MDDMEHGAACSEYSLNELILTRNILLAHLFEGDVAPKQVLRFARRYTTVTRWEELICAVFNPNSSCLMAVVSIRQKDGYSGILRHQGSVEFVRFYIDWLDGCGMRAVGLSHFRVCDAIDRGGHSKLPSYHLVSCEFEADRYSRLISKGEQPKMRAVLSWNHIPETGTEFTPVFGNQVDSQISVGSDDELMSLFNISQDLSETVLTNPNDSNPSDSHPYALETAFQ
jgi:hypothetical protein